MRNGPCPVHRNWNAVASRDRQADLRLERVDTFGSVWCAPPDLPLPGEHDPDLLHAWMAYGVGDLVGCELEDRGARAVDRVEQMYRRAVRRHDRLRLVEPDRVQASLRTPPFPAHAPQHVPA